MLPEIKMGILLVAPLAGAWIEIDWKEAENRKEDVAPLAGAWIEIIIYKSKNGEFKSLPSRERGLKLSIFSAE